MPEKTYTPWEEIERQILSPRASLSAETRGRDRAEEPVPFPPCHQPPPPFSFFFWGGVISLARRPTTDSESRVGARRRKNSRGLGRPGRRSRRKASGQARARGGGEPSINFHARIIIGKLESWLPDSRFVSPNESERVGAQRRRLLPSLRGIFRELHAPQGDNNSFTCELPPARRLPRRAADP